MVKTPKNQVFSNFLGKKLGIDHLELGYTRYPSKNLVLLFLLVGNA
jgi:hypothetical protein